MVVLRTRERGSSSVSALTASIEPIVNSAHDYDALLALIGDARFVLLGEASHGTHEFYLERARITRRLIEEKDFAAICIEGDWPDAYRVDCYLKGDGRDRVPEDALAGFTRFPAWMWRNEVVRDFVQWVRDRNALRSAPDRVGFYGLDLYSLFASVRWILQYLGKVDPDAARRARFRYACFEHFGEDSQAYGYATASRMADPCENDVVRQLVDLRSHALEYVALDGRRALDEYFSAEQNARLVQNAERYYRSLYRGRPNSWNLRDRHMLETLTAIERHLAAASVGRVPKLVVWAHNSHIGDARHTDMRRRGEVNIGQLTRERYGSDVRLIGFSTSRGTVTAAHDWDEPGRQMRVRPPLEESYERLFADVAAEGATRFVLRLMDNAPARAALAAPRLQRAIGVIYRPETERQSHYYGVDLPRQFDAMIHLDETRAIRALEPGEHWDRGIEELPETYPTGI
jgi:erythromycin esterase-like protein